MLQLQSLQAAVGEDKIPLHVQKPQVLVPYTNLICASTDVPQRKSQQRRVSSWNPELMTGGPAAERMDVLSRCTTQTRDAEAKERVSPWTNLKLLTMPQCPADGAGSEGCCAETLQAWCWGRGTMSPRPPQPPPILPHPGDSYAPCIKTPLAGSHLFLIPSVFPCPTIGPGLRLEHNGSRPDTDPSTACVAQTLNTLWTLMNKCKTHRFKLFSVS